jgi:hypothetical protein
VLTNGLLKLIELEKRWNENLMGIKETRIGEQETGSLLEGANG